MEPERTSVPDRAVSLVAAALLEARLRDGVKSAEAEARLAVDVLAAAGLLLIDGEKDAG